MDNFLVEWSPESTLGQNWARPRVYLIDFETAVHFPDDVNRPTDWSPVFPFLIIYTIESGPRNS